MFIRKNLKNFLFIDKKTNQTFIVEEKNQYEAQSVADAYFSEAVFQRTISDDEINQSAFALVKSY